VRLSCQEQMLPGATLLEKWDFARRAGFDGIELRGAGDFGLRDRLPELTRARRAGVVMPSVCPDMDHFIGDFDAERRRDAVDNLGSQLSVIAELGGLGVMTPAAYGLWSNRLPPFVDPPRSPEGDREVLTDALGTLGEHAEREGVRLWLEPLNRYADHMVNRLEQATALVLAAGGRGLGVVLDTFHANIEERDPAAAVLAAGPLIGHVQLSDSNRLQPGAGHLDFGASFVALDRVSFDGYMAFECLLDGEPSIVLPRAVRYVRERDHEGQADGGDVGDAGGHRGGVRRRV
jgi:sugar phosphate isomerase/epimerase